MAGLKKRVLESDKEFRKGVLHSNKLDARAVYDLGLIIQKLSYDSFNYYPKTLVSTGSLARASLVATIFGLAFLVGFIRWSITWEWEWHYYLMLYGGLPFAFIVIGGILEILIKMERF